jgi:uncharacterized membrane protein YfcA
MLELYKETGLTYLLISIAASMLIGASKTGLKGLGMTAIPIMAYVFGGRFSTGLILPLLISADIFAVLFYKRDCEWKYIYKLLPWTLIGIGFGLVVGEHISDKWFKTIMGIIILGGMIILFIREQNKDKLRVPDFWWFSMLLGLTGGFATMIGNAAGAVMTLYLISMNLPKKAFIGTAAWFFFIINLIKLPLHVFIWETVNFKTFSYDIILIPGIAIGAFIGFRLVKFIPERGYRYFVIAVTTISALLLFK